MLNDEKRVRHMNKWKFYRNLTLLTENISNTFIFIKVRIKCKQPFMNLN